MAIAYDRGPAQRGSIQRTGGSGSLAELLNVILDKGIVIDAWARVSVVGLEVLTVEARVVVASVETYLRYAEAIGLTTLAAAPPQQGQAGRQNGQLPGGRERRDGEQGQPPSPEDVLGYLSDHPEGVRLGEMSAFFNVPRRELADVVNELVEDDRAQRDEEHQLYFAAEEQE